MRFRLATQFSFLNQTTNHKTSSLPIRLDHLFDLVELGCDDDLGATVFGAAFWRFIAGLGEEFAAAAWGHACGRQPIFDREDAHD